MPEQQFIVRIVELIAEHWDIFKYVFLGLAVKYIGQGLFEASKALVLIGMGVAKVWKKRKF